MLQLSHAKTLLQIYASFESSVEVQMRNYCGENKYRFLDESLPDGLIPNQLLKILLMEKLLMNRSI